MSYYKFIHKEWTEEQRNSMEDKFFEFQRKKADRSLRWDYECKTIGFNIDDEVQEDLYWKKRFESEYESVINGEPDANPYALADIHAYIFYCMGDLMLDSENYPDKTNCLKLLKSKITYYKPFIHLEFEQDTDYDQECELTQEQRNEVEEKFTRFRYMLIYKSLTWDFGYKTIEFGYDGAEERYWKSKFDKKYHNIRRYSFTDRSLVADIHAYIYYVTDEMMLGSEEYPDTHECLNHLEPKTIYYD